MPVGLSKPVKKLVQDKLPDLSGYQDISEFIEKGGLLSESEAEFDGPENEVKLEEDYKSRGSINLKSVNNSTSAIRLSEIGPRLKLKLVKIEEGVCDGEVLYHDLIKKTPEELKILRDNLKQRKKEEKANKLLKQKTQKLNKNHKKNKNSNDDDEVEGEESKKDEAEGDYDEDLEYYKQEIGKEPDSEFLNQRQKSLKRKRDSNDKEEFSNKKNMQVNYYLNGDMEPKKKKESDDDDNGRENARDKNKKLVKFGNKKENALNHKNGAVKAKFFGFSKKKLQTKK